MIATCPATSRSDDEVDARVDALYAGPPEDFVAARDRLAADLKASGDPEAAKSVKALRRPTVAAWALNQLARRHPDDVQALLDAGRDLRDAQAKAMAGGGPEALREATARRRAATRTLVDRAGRILAEAGRGADAQRDAVAGTLDAAALDEEVGRRLVAGRLEREEAPPSGLGGLEQLADVIPLPTRGRAAKTKGSGSAASDDAKPGGRPTAPKIDPRVERLATDASRGPLPGRPARPAGHEARGRGAPARARGPGRPGPRDQGARRGPDGAARGTRGGPPSHLGRVGGSPGRPSVNARPAGDGRRDGHRVTVGSHQKFDVLLTLVPV